MSHWIPFSDGEYLLDHAFLVAANQNAVGIDDVIVEVYSDQRGQRYLRGRGRIRNILMVELLEDSDELELLLDFGQEFKYLLKSPILHGGKVFAPDVRSILQFTPREPWEPIAEKEFDKRLAQLRILSVSD